MLHRTQNILIYPTGDATKVRVLSLGGLAAVKIGASLVPSLLSDPATDTEINWGRRLDVSMRAVSRLNDAGVLATLGSPIDMLDADITANWRWGLESAALHILSGAGDHPETQASGKDCPDVYTLPAPDVSGLLKTITVRRSVRRFSGVPLRQAQLSSLLFAGVGVLGYKTDRYGNQYPLTTAPSGGACDPIFATVVVRRCQGIAPGLFRYVPGSATLDPVCSLRGDEASIFADGQAWGGSAAVLINLVADVRRTMRRYSGPSSYQVVLLEAGHRAQNVLLAASELGLGACVTGAIKRRIASKRLDLEWPWATPIYTVAIGVADSRPQA